MAGLWMAAICERSVKAATTRADAVIAGAWADTWERDRARQRHERRSRVRTYQRVARHDIERRRGPGSHTRLGCRDRARQRHESAWNAG